MMNIIQGGAANINKIRPEELRLDNFDEFLEMPKKLSEIIGNGKHYTQDELKELARVIKRLPFHMIDRSNRQIDDYLTHTIDLARLAVESIGLNSNLKGCNKIEAALTKTGATYAHEVMTFTE